MPDAVVPRARSAAPPRQPEPELIVECGAIQLPVCFSVDMFRKVYMDVDICLGLLLSSDPRIYRM